MDQGKYCIYFCNSLVMDEKEGNNYAQDLHDIMKKNQENNWPDKFFNSMISPHNGLKRELTFMFNKIDEQIGESPACPDICTLVFNSLGDICVKPGISLKALYVLDHLGYTIYITSFSFYKSFNQYAENLYDKYHVTNRKPNSPFPPDLLEYAADIRINQEWSYKTITDKTGIKRDTLIKYLHRTESTGCLHDAFYGRSESESKKFGRTEEDIILLLKCGISKKVAKKWAEKYDEKRHGHKMN